MSQTILYYPTINIRDSAWLRNAMLYWDNVSSIVPSPEFEHFSTDICYLIAADIFKPIYPAELFHSNHADDFVWKVIQRIEQYEEVQGYHNGGDTLFDRYIHKKKLLDHNKNFPKDHISVRFLHNRKLCDELLYYLENKGYIASADCYGDWIPINRNISDIYMKTLAEYVIKCYPGDMIIGTDKKSYLDGFYVNQANQNDSLCMSIALSNCLPQPSKEVSFEDLLFFKKHHKQEFDEFRQVLRNFERVISQCQSSEEIKFEMQCFREKWERVLHEKNSLLKGKFVLGTLFALVESMAIANDIKAALDAVSPEHTVAMTGLLLGSAAIHIGAHCIDISEKVSNTRSSPGFSYLIQASQNEII